MLSGCLTADGVSVTVGILRVLLTNRTCLKPSGQCLVLSRTTHLCPSHRVVGVCTVFASRNGVNSYQNRGNSATGIHTWTTTRHSQQLLMGQIYFGYSMLAQLEAVLAKHLQTNITHREVHLVSVKRFESEALYN